MRFHVSIAVLLAILVILVLGLDVAFFDRHTFATTLFDDSFYYSQIARHLALGHGFTFDGIHRTNGFQPLWLFLLIPIFRWVPGDFAPLYATVALQIALVAGSAVGLYAVLWKRWGHAAAFATGLLLVAQPNAKWIVRSGMETPLVVVTIVVIWWLWQRAREVPSDGARWVQLGLACGALVWTRLEASVIVLIIIVCARDQLRTAPRCALALVVPFALALAGYVAWNRVAFQTWFAISGMVKLTWHTGTPWSEYGRVIVETPWLGHELFARITGGQLIFASSQAVKIAYAIVSGIAFALLFRFRRSLADSLHDANAGPIIIACIVIWSIHAILLAGGEWHDYPLLVATAILGGGMLSRHRSWAPWAAAALAAIALAHTTARIRHLGRRPNDIDCIVRAAEWLHAHVEERTRIGSWDAGRIGYFSHRTVVNLDGLVNDARYFHDVLEARQFDEYVRRERIDWLADNIRELSSMEPDQPDLERQYPLVFTACPPTAGLNMYVFRRRGD